MTTTTGAVAGIQARMGSTRLAGKSLANLAGKPMLQRVYERASAARSLDAVIVLTSTSSADDELAHFCSEVHIPCRRGSESDVMSRYLDLVDEFTPRYLVRITGDCPLISPKHIDLQLEALSATDADFTALLADQTSSVLEGQGALSVRALREAGKSSDPRDREHVGAFYFAAQNERFRTVELRCDSHLLRDDLRLTVDEREDLELMQAVFENFAPTHDSLAPLKEVIAWLDEHSEIREANRSVGTSPETRDAHQRRQRAVRNVIAHWPPDPFGT